MPEMWKVLSSVKILGMLQKVLLMQKLLFLLWPGIGKVEMLQKVLLLLEMVTILRYLSSFFGLILNSASEGSPVSTITPHRSIPHILELFTPGVIRVAL